MGRRPTTLEAIFRATQDLTPTQTGIYVRLLVRLTQSGSLPTEPMALCRIAGIQPKYQHYIPAVVQALEPISREFLEASKHKQNQTHRTKLPPLSDKKPENSLGHKFPNDTKHIVPNYLQPDFPPEPPVCNHARVDSYNELYIQVLEPYLDSERGVGKTVSNSPPQPEPSPEEAMSTPAATDLFGSPLSEPITPNDTIASQSPVKARTAKKAKLATTLPDDLEIQPSDRSYAERNGIEPALVDVEFERFKNHALTHGRTCKNWVAAWRNWVLSRYVSNRRTSLGPTKEYHQRTVDPYSKEGRKQRLAAFLGSNPIIDVTPGSWSTDPQTAREFSSD